MKPNIFSLVLLIHVL